ncbi:MULTISPECIES: transposase domain-containing protein [Pseudomonas syringae group]|uniref:transposase domain-containing protein n=1 Tax=Pseudomonas syringae group TaxID=136849 RepID=UPI001E3B60EA|nr:MULTISPECIES: transposase domain-containing protein [Pseudomonas syringae group]
MSVAQDLGAVLDFAEQPLSRLDVFTDHIPQEWISAAATLAEKATIRHRRLPSDMVLWLVVGTALSRGEPIVWVARRLNICAALMNAPHHRQCSHQPLPQGRNPFGQGLYRRLLRLSKQHCASCGLFVVSDFFAVTYRLWLDRRRSRAQLGSVPRPAHGVIRIR